MKIGPDSSKHPSSLFKLSASHLDSTKNIAILGYVVLGMKKKSFWNTISVYFIKGKMYR